MILFLLVNCAPINKTAQIKYEDEILSLELPGEELERIQLSDSELIDDIIAFRKANNDEEVEIIVVKDFIELEKCRTPTDCEYINLPNDLQAIFNFYKSVNAEKYAWIIAEENRHYKNLIINFLIKHTDL